MDSKALAYTGVLFILAGKACAYIDPGTGGMIVGGSIWPMIMAAFAVVSGLIYRFFNPLKGVFFSLKKIIFGEG